MTICLLHVLGYNYAGWLCIYLPLSMHAYRCEYTDDSWLLSIINEVLNAFLSWVSPMGALWVNNTHTHISLLLYKGPVSPPLPHQTFLFSPARGPLVGLLSLLSPQALSYSPAHLAPPCCRRFSSCHHTAWFWEAQKCDSFTPKQKAFDGDGPGEWSPDQSKRDPAHLSFHRGDFQKNSRDMRRMRGNNFMLCPKMWPYRLILET